MCDGRSGFACADQHAFHFRFACRRHLARDIDRRRVCGDAEAGQQCEAAGSSRFAQLDQPASIRHSVSIDLTAFLAAAVLRTIFACLNFSLSQEISTSSGFTDLLNPPNEYMPFFAVCVTYLMPPLICAVTLASTIGLPEASFTNPKKR